MSKKIPTPTVLSQRPDPPNVEEILADVEAAGEDDVIFRSSDTPVRGSLATGPCGRGHWALALLTIMWPSLGPSPTAPRAQASTPRPNLARTISID